MQTKVNRKRPIQVKFFVDERELSTIKERMVQFGTENLSTYLRTMAMEGIFPPAEDAERPDEAKQRRF